MGKYKRLLEKKGPTLTQTINLEGSTLLAEMVSRDVFTSQGKAYTEKQGPNFKQVENLVATLLTKSDKQVEEFIEALQVTGHGHVAEDMRHFLCEEETSDTTGGATGGRQAEITDSKMKQPTTLTDHALMSETHKAALQKNLEILSDNLVADGMLNKLVAEDIITLPEQQALLAEPVIAKRATALLHILITREDRAYYILIEGLKKYRMPHLAQLLEKADK